MANIRETEKKYARIVALLREKGLTVSAMESCTGGLVASLITDVSGASEVFPGGYVTYSNTRKEESGVPAEMIAEHGVYSRETAQSMAEAAAREMRTDFGIGITGSLGRMDPANRDSVPGEVFVALCGPVGKDPALGDRENMRSVKLEQNPQTDTPAHRRQAKLAAAAAAADLLLSALSE